MNNESEEKIHFEREVDTFVIDLRLLQASHFNTM